jgi:hypothetical protein
MAENKREALPRDETLWLASHRDSIFRISFYCQIIKHIGDIRTHHISFARGQMGEEITDVRGAMITAASTAAGRAQSLAGKGSRDDMCKEARMTRRKRQGWERI